MPETPERRWNIARSAVFVTGLTAISTLLGFVRDVVVAAVFGAGDTLDAYLVAQGLMTIVLGLVAGAMARAVTPVAAREAAAEGAACRGHRSVDVALSVTIVALGVVGAVMGLLAVPITAVLAPGFDDEQVALAATLTRVVLLATVLVAATNMLAALAQAHGRFTWAALEGVPFNLAMIVAAALFGPRYGISALAVGFVVGSAARLLLQLPPLRALGTRIRPSFALRDPGFREIARLTPSLLVGGAVGNVNTLVDRAVASTLEPGAIAALSYGWRLVNLPETMLVAALVVPLYPALSAAVERPEEVRRLVGKGLSATVTVLVPTCIVLVVAAGPLTEVVFQRGAFDAEAARATATAVAWYTPGLLALGMRLVLVRTFYALGNARAPVVVAVVAMAVNVVGDLLLGPLFGIAGVALATSLSFVVAASVNGWQLHRQHRGLPVGAVGAVLARALALGAAAGVVAIVVRSVVAGAPAVAVVSAVAVATVATYAAGLWLLRAPERRLLTEALRAVRRR